MARVKTKNRVGVYGTKTRKMQSDLTYQTFQMTFKTANIYRYLGSRANETPHINDIQNTTFFEVADRAYDTTPVPIHIGMEPFGEGKMDFSQFGIINPLAEEIRIRVHEKDFYCLGREIIVGDAVEIPFLMEDCKKTIFEVSDVDDDPSFEKFYFVVTLKPMNDSRKTREVDLEMSNEDIFTDMMNQSDKQYEKEVPFEGLDESTINDAWERPTEPVDYRRKQQKSFLDDPLFDFTGEDE